jgi:hypothetical protein
MTTDIVVSTSKVEATSPAASSGFSMEAQAVMYPGRSYAAEADRTPLKLRYFQAQFDLCELLARKLQNELAGGINGIEADRRLTYYRNLMVSQWQRIADDTQAGTDDNELQLVEYEIRRQLEEIGSPDVPEVVPSPVRYGLWVGTGATFPTGKIADYFSAAWDFTFGLTVSWHRFALEGSITYASPSIKDPWLVEPEYEAENYRANVKNANYLTLGFGLGYNVLDTKHFILRPYVGGMWTSYSWTARPADPTTSQIVFDGLQKRMMLDDFNFTAGLIFEWHFHSTVTSFPIFGSMREEYISSLRLNPYITRAVYTDATRHFGGWQIGLTLGYSGVGRALGIK